MRIINRPALVALLAILLDVIARHAYRWSESQLEPRWQNAGHLGFWWLFSFIYFLAEYSILLAIVVALVPKQSLVRVFGPFALLAMDLATVIVFLDLATIVAFDRVLAPHLSTLGLKQLDLLFLAMACVSFLIMVCRIKVLGAEFRKLQNGQTFQT